MIYFITTKIIKLKSEYYLLKKFYKSLAEMENGYFI